MKKGNVEKDVLSKVLKSCTLYERIIVNIHLKICVKIYRKGLQDGFNWCNEKW